MVFMVEKAPVNALLSFPAPRLFAPLAALMLVASGCGLVGGSSDEEAPAGASADAPEDEDASQEDSTEEESSETPSLADPGILTADCDVPMGWVEYTLHSSDSAEQLLHARFDIMGSDRGESEDLSHGRFVDAGIALPSSCHESEQPPLFPERNLVMATFTEEVNGNEVSGFGVLSEDGMFTALSPEQEVGDFATPINYIHPVADPERDRIVFVQDEGGSEHGIHAMDLESGEITDLGATCPSTRCDQLTVVPGIDAAVLYGDYFNSMAVVPDGSGVVGSLASRTLFYFDISDQAGADVVDLTRDTIYPDRSPEVPVDRRSNFQILGEGLLLFADDELSVIEFTADTPATYEAENENVLHHELEPLPVERTLIPAGTRSNSRPVLSPDGSEVIFLSQPETGDPSWYRVPTEGGDEPVEFPGLPWDLHKVLAWT